MILFLIIIIVIFAFAFVALPEDFLSDPDTGTDSGYVTEEGMPAVMVTPQNTTITLRAQGWQANV